MVDIQKQGERLLDPAGPQLRKVRGPITPVDSQADVFVAYTLLGVIFGLFFGAWLVSGMPT